MTPGSRMASGSSTIGPEVGVQWSGVTAARSGVAARRVSGENR
jgi:hypothetical protein